MSVTRYRCSNCQGTFDVFVTPAVAPPCENGTGQMEVFSTGATMPTPQTGCKKGKQKFLASAFERTAFVPATARGKFDCSYRPSNGNLNINLKLAATYGGSWSEWFSSTEQAQLRTNLSERVPAYWNGKCTLRCTRHGWTDVVVRPVISVDFGSSGSHFKLIISKEDSRQNAHGRECRGFVSLNQVTDPEATDRAELRDFQTREFNHTVGGLLTAGNDREFVENALINSGATITRPGGVPTATLSFEAGSADTAGVAAVLREFVRRANLQLAGSHPVPVIVKGGAHVPELPTLARQRAEAVRNFLTTTAGLKNPVTLDDAVGIASTVEIKLDRGFEASFATGEREFQYNVSAHEFGHMIGLPDEYENPTEGSKFVVKTNYLQLVQRAAQRPPIFPSHTSSMMSDGMTLMPWHYVTIWEALAYLTRDYLEEDEWTIHMT